MDESQGALGRSTRIEAFNDVALHSTMSEVYMALVDTRLVSAADTANHRANQVGRVMPQARDVASMGPTTKITLEYCIAQRVGGASLSYAILVVGHVVRGVVGATLVVTRRNLARSQLAIRLAIMDALEGLRRLLGRQALKLGNTTGIGILVELEAAVDALLGRHDRPLRILRRELLLLHHALLVALKI